MRSATTRGRSRAIPTRSTSSTPGSPDRFWTFWVSIGSTTVHSALPSRLAPEAAHHLDVLPARGVAGQAGALEDGGKSLEATFSEKRANPLAADLPLAKRDVPVAI